MMHPVRPAMIKQGATIGARLTTAIDVVSALRPEELPAGEAYAMALAKRHSFHLPRINGSVDRAAHYRRMTQIFVHHMRPIFNEEIGRCAASAQVSRIYTREELVHADISKAVEKELLDRETAMALCLRVQEDAERLLPVASDCIATNPWLSRRWIGLRAAADIAVFGAVFAVARDPLVAAIAAGAFAVKLEGFSIFAGRSIARRAEAKIAARKDELKSALASAKQGALELGAS